MVGACAGFSGMMAVVRQISPNIHPFEAAFFRNILGMLFMLPWLLHAGARRLRTGRPGMHLLRAVTGLGAICCCSPRSACCRSPKSRRRCSQRSEPR
jgi:drug/metabolite transporter (DMT)-like permease